MSRRRPPRAVVLVLTCAGDLAPKGELNRVVIGEAKYLPNHRLKLLLARGPRLHGDLVGLAVVDDRHDGIGLGQAGVRLLPVGQRGVAEAALVLLPAGERVGGQAGGERVGRLLARASRLLLLHPRKITGGLLVPLCCARRGTRAHLLPACCSCHLDRHGRWHIITGQAHGAKSGDSSLWPSWQMKHMSSSQLELCCLLPVRLTVTTASHMVCLGRASGHARLSEARFREQLRAS